MGNNPVNFVDPMGLAAEGPTQSGSSYPGVMTDVSPGGYDFSGGPVLVAGGSVRSRATGPGSPIEEINAAGVQMRYAETLRQLRSIDRSYQAPASVGPPGAARSEGEVQFLQQELVRQQEAFHYTFSTAVSSIQSQGLRPGSYATPSGTLSPLQAQIDLALAPNRGLPGALLRVDLAGLRQAGYEIPAVTQVGRSFGMPGGGFEMRFPYSIPPEFITVIRR